MRVLGIESSCDETAAAVVEIDSELNCTLLTNSVATSMDLHSKYGGVVPEIAARSHIESIIPVIDQAIAPVGWNSIDAIAVTRGAGLGGSLLVGVMTARTLAISKAKPLYGVNHVEGHIYANYITQVGGSLSDLNLVTPAVAPEFPLLGLIVSGGHSQLVLWRNHFDYTLLGRTQDDAVGEAFDKVAKMTGLPYPGGPSVGLKALEGDAYAFNLPKAKMAGKYDFSFSGLKTAVLRQAQSMIGADFTFPSKDLPQSLSEADKANIAAVFQRIAIETIVDKVVLAFEEYKPVAVVIGGGVAASPELRRQLSDRLSIPINYQDPRLMTDNGAMIATLGAFYAQLGRPADDPYSLQIYPNLSM